MLWCVSVVCNMEFKNCCTGLDTPQISHTYRLSAPLLVVSRGARQKYSLCPMQRRHASKPVHPRLQLIEYFVMKGFLGFGLV
jgi:hypothetical protein